MYVIAKGTNTVRYFVGYSNNFLDELWSKDINKAKLFDYYEDGILGAFGDHFTVSLDEEERVIQVEKATIIKIVG